MQEGGGRRMGEREVGGEEKGEVRPGEGATGGA